MRPHHDAGARRGTAGAVALAVLTALAGPAAAQSDPTLPLWEVGVAAFGVSQQAYPGSSEQVQRALVVPFGLYRGPLLRADRGGAGLRPIRTDTFELDIGFSGAFGSNSSDIPVRAGMPDLGTLVEFGPRATWLLGDAPFGGEWRLKLPVRGVFDVSDGFANRGVTIEPELEWERRIAGHSTFDVEVGAVWGNRRLAQHFYGVAPVYATPTRAAYEADAGLVTLRASVGYTRRFGPDWRAFVFARVDSVAGAANRDSPLVDRTTGATVGVGVSYTFLRSSRTAVD